MTDIERVPTVHDSLLQVSHDILTVERDVNVIQSGVGSLIWNSHPELYPVRGLGIKAEILGSLATGFTIREADFIMDEGECSLLVVSDSPETLDDDPYALEFLTIFKNAFAKHTHKRCEQLAPLVTCKATGTRLTWLP